MTLMPVSNISWVGMRSSTVGAERWIGQRASSSTSTASPSSIGSPSRLKKRPSVTWPTGTVIGPPVSTTSIPRDRPSVVSMATARTRSSPRCCWTSQTRSAFSVPETSSSSAGFVSRWTTMAWLISGSSSGKTASITTPVISSIRPTLRCSSSERSSVRSSVALMRVPLLAQRLGAGDDFHDLLGDLGLARAVHLERQVVDDLLRVVGGAAHRGHAGAVLGRGGLEQGAIDRDLHVVRDEALEDLLGARLVLDEPPLVALLVLVPAVLRVLVVTVVVLAEDG